MPYYTFKDKTKKRAKEVTIFMQMHELDDYLKDNPNLEQQLSGAPAIGYSTVTRQPDGWFKDKLRALKKNHPHHTIGKNTKDWT